MKLRDFRLGWRALVREPAYSLVVVLGLGIGFAACLLLLGFVRHSWQYNAGLPHVERAWIIKQRFNMEPTSPWFDQAPLYLRAVAVTLPGVELATAYAPMRPRGERLGAKVDGQLMPLDGLMVLPGFTDMLGLQALHGDLHTALEQPDTIVITEAAALRLFGRADVLGQVLVIDTRPVRVSAVVRTPPANTTIPFEALVGGRSILMPDAFYDEMVTGARGWWGKMLLRLHPQAQPEAVMAALQRASDAAPFHQKVPPDVRERLGKRKVMDIELAPLRHAYFDTDVAANHIASPGERANPAVVAGLGALALLILALAAINYVNLATVRVLRRQREVALRKVMGADARQLGLQFLAEAMLVALLATGIGLLLAWAALPLFASLMDRRLDSLLSLANVGAALGLGLLLGTVTAIYPAWIALRVHPAHLLAGRPDTESAGGMRLRRMMTVLQVATAMGLAGVTLAVAWQTHYARSASAGFDPAPLLIVDLHEERDPTLVRNFVTALSAQNGVAGVALSSDAVGRHNTQWFQSFRHRNGPHVSMDMKEVSPNFFTLYGVRAQAGRLFDAALDKEDERQTMVITAAAARQLGFATPEAALGVTLVSNDDDGKLVPRRVIGIAPELRFESLHVSPRPTAFVIGSGGATLTVRAHGALAPLEPMLQALWSRYFPTALLRTHRADDILAADYADEARIGRLMMVATAIALAIAGFGTYALSAHTVQRRAREIVMRKLHGARRRDIGVLVLREIGMLTAVAALIALPLAALGIQRYLAGYVDHAPIGYWTLLAALVATSAVALAAVTRHAWIAMRMAPAAALRQ